MTTYGYARVSTDGQSVEVQQDLLRKAGVDTVLSENITGTTMDRPALTELLGLLQSGDTIVVYALDRLGRTPEDLMVLVRDLKRKGITIRSLTETSDDWFTRWILAGVAGKEREKILERTEQGRRRCFETGQTRTGRWFGRPSVLSSGQLEQAKQWLSEGLSQRTVAKRLGVSNATISRRVSV